MLKQPYPLPRPITLALAPALTALIALMGCQAAPHAGTASSADSEAKAAQAQDQARFINEFQRVLLRDLSAANRTPLVGIINLRVTLDRMNQTVGCQTSPASAELLKALPAGVKRSDPQALSDLVMQQCWRSLYPRVPAHMFSDDDTLEIIAPLVLAPAQDPSGTNSDWVVRNAKREFFWEQLVSKQAVDSIGRAAIHFEGDAHGKVLGCLVNLHPAAARPEAFKVDGALQVRLNARCRTLDLRQMPGFAPNAQGRVDGYVTVEYAPWKADR